MQWLSQNWVWLALAVGALWLISRARHGETMGGCGSQRSAQDGPAAADNKALVADADRAPIEDESARHVAERSAARRLQDRGGCC